MSRGDKSLTDSTSIEAILKSLSSRPNVQHTIILSRRDGSIIRATGFAEAMTVPPSHADGVEIAANTDNSNERPASKSSETSAAHKETPAISPAERLAHSIYTFVKTSDSLAANLLEVESASDNHDNTNSTDTGRTSSKRPIVETGKTNIDNYVQLLRMRTKKQEIIIFPDTNYLCCVVQNVARGVNTENER